MGQRVKKVKVARASNIAEVVPSGSEGVVIAIESRGGKCSCGCGLDYRATPRRPIQVHFASEPGCKVACVTWECLEPIMPEGNKVVSWSECAWNPDMLRQEVGCPSMNPFG